MFPSSHDGHGCTSDDFLRVGLALQRKADERSERMVPQVDSMVRTFDPRTLGVVKVGRVLSVGRKYARVDFGLTGVARVAFRDILEDVS